jgi:hypothetical protein
LPGRQAARPARASRSCSRRRRAATPTATATATATPPARPEPAPATTGNRGTPPLRVTREVKTTRHCCTLVKRCSWVSARRRARDRSLVARTDTDLAGAKRGSPKTSAFRAVSSARPQPRDCCLQTLSRSLNRIDDYSPFETQAQSPAELRDAPAPRFSNRNRSTRWRRRQPEDLISREHGHLKRRGRWSRSSPEPGLCWRGPMFVERLGTETSDARGASAGRTMRGPASAGGWTTPAPGGRSPGIDPQVVVTVDRLFFGGG